MPMTQLTHVPASINVDGLTGDVAVRGQQEHGVSDFLGSSEATYWHKSGLDAAVVANHIGLYERWSDRVGGDALLGQQTSVAMHQAEHAGFASGIVRANHSTGLGGNGGEEDEASPLALAHAGQDCLRHLQRQEPRQRRALCRAIRQ